jgi:predicted glycosyltransferase involved in capsule biosynthesis
MIDLSNATFIIPLRIESEDRLRNIITVLCFLLGNFDTKIIVKEVDKSSVFIEEVIPQIHEFLGKDSHITHIFEKSDDPVFYRMHILNEMLAMSKTDVVINYDCDVLLPVESYVSSYNSILNKECDVIYPFGSGNYQKQIHATDELVSDFLNNDFDFSILDRKSNIWSSDFGWVQFFNRQVYIDGGMENENFKGSSPEDKERFYRFTTLGYNVGRINNLIYHLEHSRGSNSWPTSMHGNPYMRNNLELWETIQKMNREQLLEYYSTQSYLKKYVSI